MCHQAGMRPFKINTTVLPGAVRALQDGEEESALKEAYSLQFSEVPQMAAWGAQKNGPPRLRTKAESVASGNRVLTGESTAKQEAYHDVDNNTMQLWYHDKNKHTLYDLAHEFGNVIKQSFSFMKNKTTSQKQRFTPKAREFETKKLQRFPGLVPIKTVANDKKIKTSYPRPGWVASNQQEVDHLPDICKTPSGWADYRRIFKDLGFAKTAETLLFAGDVGAYTMRQVDIDPTLRLLFIEMFRLIGRCMHKVSTPMDRQYLRKHLPIVMTKIEMALPLTWNTTVVHIFVFHTLSILESAGPFCSSNMLDIERFHTQFKKLAKGTRNIMASINNHYGILEASLLNRATAEMTWTTPARRSSIAGVAEKADSALRTDRCVRPLGASVKSKLTPEEFILLQDLWSIEEKGYDKFRDRFATFNRRRPNSKKVSNINDWKSSRKNIISDQEKIWQTMTADIKVYRRAEYAGYKFADYKTQKNRKSDDSHFRVEYREQIGRSSQTVLKQAYASIRQIFVHAMYPGGPEKVVVEGRWLENMGKCPIAGTNLVRHNVNASFNQPGRQKFTFLETCYHMPVALWPFDPLNKLPHDDRRKKFYDIIDRNQDE